MSGMGSTEPASGRAGIDYELIAIGASWGGLHAVSTLLVGLSP